MRRLSILLLLTLVLLLAACGGGEEAEDHTIDENDTSPTTEAVEQTAEAMLDGEGEADGEMTDGEGEAATDGDGETATDGDGETGTDDGASSTGDVAAGEELFAQMVVDGAPGCATCHSLEAGVQMAGPSLAGLGDRAGSTVDGQSAEEYVHQSIVAPNEHVVEGYAEGVMYQQYGETLSEQQIDDLVAYLLTQ